jgi:hypothetical protein
MLCDPRRRPGRTRLIDPVDGEPRRVAVTDCRPNPSSRIRVRKGDVCDFSPDLSN